ADKSIKSSKFTVSSKDSHGNAVVFTMPYGGNKNELHLTSTCAVDTSLTLIQSAFTHHNIYKQANDLALANPNSQMHLLLQSEAKILWTKSLPSYTKLVNAGQINLFGGLSEQFFEQFFQNSLDQNLLVTKSRATSTRQIDQWLLLILAINVTGISINEEGIYLKNKDLPEEISFPPDDEQKKQRYRLTDVSFCNSNHHVADIHFENIKNSGWYQYDRMGKTYRARAMHIGNARPPHRNGYVMDF
ncbi:4852_t:CDS:2, partial [Gigaspora rosea]